MTLNMSAQSMVDFAMLVVVVAMTFATVYHTRWLRRAPILALVVLVLALLGVNIMLNAMLGISITGGA